MNADPAEDARADFHERFGSKPAFFGIAPGRVELLGNHTDYNGGLVLATAIDRFTVVAGCPVSGRESRVGSTFSDRQDRFSVDEIGEGEPGDWGRYVRGVVKLLGAEQGGIASGFEASIAGNVPIGAGLSSSASLEAATALFLLGSGVVPGGADLDDVARMELAKLLQRVENEFVGVASGLLDQFSVLFGEAGKGLALDCRSLEYERLPLGNPAPAIVVCDSKTSRRLADGMYNRRREECERVVTYFRERRGEGVTQLRDVSLDDLDASWDDLDPVGRRRARHVLTENERVRRGGELLKSGDAAGFAQLMSASHASSRDDFENSSAALDALIVAAETSPGFLGGKLSGAGWAGCTVNLVKSNRAKEFAESVREHYARAMGVDPIVHVCHAADGARAIETERGGEPE